MFYQKNIQMGFYDGYVEKRTRKNTFFKQINMLIDWSEVEKEIVERTFGSMRRWFRCGVARYIGLAKTHTQHLLEAIAYNLYRAPGIIISNGIK